MSPPVEWFMALRFLRDGRMQTVLIIAGVGVGVAVIVFLSALISGLQDNLIAQTLGSQAHIVLRPAEPLPRPQPLPDPDTIALRTIDRTTPRDPTVREWQRTMAALERHPGVTAVAPIASGPAFAQRGTATRAVLVRGSELVMLEAIVPLGDRIVEGRHVLGAGDALIGARLAADLGLGVGDTLRLTAGDGLTATATVRGVFELGNREVDARWVILPLRAAQSLLGFADDVTELNLTVAEIFDADTIAAQLSRATGQIAESWMTLNAQLLTGLRSQSASSLMIQVFIILAVAMGIASVLVVSVVQRSREIGILRAMGTPRARILRIFLIQGLVVGIAGATVGLTLGGGLALFFESLAKSAEGGPTFPITLEPGLIATSVAIAVGTGLVAAVLPARRAARLDPVAAIRNE
jgi:lipoprotein-releasing system permease protein